MELNRFLLVFIGGGLGSLMRYGVNLLVYHVGWFSFPWATFSVNLIGCFLFGFFNEYIPSREPLRLLLTTGFCGGFTTFSAFGFEMQELLQGGDWPRAVIYVLFSVIFGVLGCFAGLYAGKL
jgi:CrcB protein